MCSRVLTACSFRSKSIPQQVFHRCRSAEALRLFRVPAVYLTSAFLWFFSILLFRRINNLADAHKRRFDVVCVRRFDRFARSVSHLLRALETFKALGIDLFRFRNRWTLRLPTERWSSPFLGAVAELERSLIVERVRAGLRNAKAKGKRLGRPRVTVDTRRITALRSQGLSWAKIGEAIGLGEGTVRRSPRASARNPSDTAPVNV